MQLKWRQVRGIAEKLRVALRGERHRIGWLEYEGRKILQVKLSKGEGDVPGRVADKIRQQYRLNEQQFFDLRDCPLTYEGYGEILRAKGLL